MVGLVAVAALLSACSGSDTSVVGATRPDPSGTSATPAADPVRYVALGDSFVAGPGIGATSGTCLRSDRNFPSLVARTLKVAEFTDASCSGATTAEYTRGQGENPPQFDALTPDTTLVTLGSMGGNDVGLVRVASQCVLGTCGSSGVQQLQASIDALQPVIVDSVDQVRQRSPRARILLVGYGTYLPSQACAALPSVTTAEMRHLQGVVDRLSDTIEAAAAEAEVEFVDMRKIPGVRRHTACAPMARQWIRGLDAGGDGMMFHPSSAGMRAMAGQVEKVLAS